MSDLRSGFETFGFGPDGFYFTDAQLFSAPKKKKAEEGSQKQNLKKDAFLKIIDTPGFVAEYMRWRQTQPPKKPGWKNRRDV